MTPVAQVARKIDFLWTAEIDAELIRRRRRGETWAYIGGIFGVSPQAAQQHGAVLRRRGLIITPPCKRAWDDRPDLRARLIALRAENVPASEIARQLGVSVNAVSGAANRLGLPAPPRPQAKGSSHARRRVPRGAATIPPLASLEPPPPPYRRVEPCAFPMDHPTRPGRFLACDAPSEPGRPYCPVHCAVAYQQRRVAAGVPA